MSLDTFANGGMLWFSNLNVPDPYYILPALSCSTIFLIMQFGAEGVALNDMEKNMRNIMRLFPIPLFALIYNFPSVSFSSVFWEFILKL